MLAYLKIQTKYMKKLGGVQGYSSRAEHVSCLYEVLGLIPSTREPG